MTVARPVRMVTLVPGQRVGVVVDLGERLRFPGPGPYAVRAARLPLEDPGNGVARSEWVRVEVGR